MLAFLKPLIVPAPLLAQLDGPGAFGPFWNLIFFLVWLFIWLSPMVVFLWLAYYFLSLPMRRKERAGLFLDLLESGLDSGRSVAHTFIGVAETGDRNLGGRFLRLAGHLKAGCKLSEALVEVPRLLPPQMVAMIRAGEELGDLRKILPGCRRLLADEESHLQGAVNYLMVLAFGMTPLVLFLLGAFGLYILPQYKAIAAGFDIPRQEGVEFVLDHLWLIFSVMGSLMLLLWGVVFVYTGGPRLHSLTDFCLGNLIGRIQFALPWRRKRMQRNFSTMLGVLLDSGLPENLSLRFAGACACNPVFESRCEQAAQRLATGTKLTEAVESIDASGEFRWRLANAAHGKGGFLQALAGWIASLDARAFQQEQTAAQLASTALVVFNGAVIGAITVSVFKLLMAIIDSANLW